MITYMVCEVWFRELSPSSIGSIILEATQHLKVAPRNHKQIAINKQQYLEEASH